MTWPTPPSSSALPSDQLDNQLDSPAAARDQLLQLKARVDELNAALVTLINHGEPLLRSGAVQMLAALKLAGNAVSPLEAVPLQQLSDRMRYGSSGYVAVASGVAQYTAIPSWATEVSVQLCNLAQSGGQVSPKLRLQLCAQDGVFGGNEFTFTASAPATNPNSPPAPAWSQAWYSSGANAAFATLHLGFLIAGGVRGRLDIIKRGADMAYEFLANSIMTDPTSSLQTAVCAGVWTPAAVTAAKGVRISADGVNTLSSGGIVVSWRG